jgi:hypothetical protein
MRNRSMQEIQRWGAYQEGRGPKPEWATSLGRHTRKCTVCHHPDREAIEAEFLRWHCPHDIAIDHEIPDPSCIYRHAHATGLFKRRSANIRLALEPIIEQATCVRVTAHAVIRAITTYAHVSDSGKWVNPAKRVRHEVVAVRPPEPAPRVQQDAIAIPAPQDPAAIRASQDDPGQLPSADLQNPNRKTQELECTPSH